MLVTISLIAIIAAIAIPNITDVFGQASEQKNRRNGQIVASLAAAAATVGYPATNFSSDDAVISLVEAGIYITNANGGVMTFQAGPFSPEDRLGIKDYIVTSNGIVTYSFEKNP